MIGPCAIDDQLWMVLASKLFHFGNEFGRSSVTNNLAEGKGGEGGGAEENEEWDRGEGRKGEKI